MNSTVPTTSALPQSTRNDTDRNDTGRKLTFAEAKMAVEANCHSLRTILDDIISKLHYQGLGNAEVLENQNIDNELIAPGKAVEVAAFQKHQIDLLIREPLKLALGRLGGLKKVIHKLGEQLRELTPDLPVSTGNADSSQSPKA